MPLRLYRHGWGWLLGHTFLLLVHVGRETGKPHDTVAMTLSYDRDHHEAAIFAPACPRARTRAFRSPPQREVVAIPEVPFGGRPPRHWSVPDRS
ncbi:MAG: hypothetical protein JJE46_05355 [Acidimicrobiia bacterium]|nr:hypothetical protein [Acidimicrobiia bacterium]